MDQIKITYDQDHKQPVVSSLQVADDFNKQHKNVLESIRGLVAKNLAVNSWFFEDTYDSRGKNYPMYLMNRDGFTLLVMGFNGDMANEWKVKYIQAFNEMERQIIDSKPKLGTREMLELMFEYQKETDAKVDLLEEKVNQEFSDLPLIGDEPDDIVASVNCIVIGLLGGKESKAYKNSSLRSKVYQDVWREVKHKFDVRKYKAIKRKYIPNIKEVLSKYTCPQNLLEEIIQVNEHVE